MPQITQIITDFFATDYTDFHKFLSVFIRSIRVIRVRNLITLTFPKNNYLCPTLLYHVENQNRHNLASFSISFRE